MQEVQASYNLLDEPWIPVVDTISGTIEELGIIDVLARSASLAGISDPSPAFEFGMYRFLEAFIMDAFGIQTIEQIKELLAAKEFDGSTIQSYIVKWRNHFNLFDADYPFYQVPAKSAEDKAITESSVKKKRGGKKKEMNGHKPVANLFYHLPSGSQPYHFFHMMEEEHAISPAVCARALCSIPPFLPIGGRGYPASINGAPPWYVLVKGTSLFETLVLNLPQAVPGNTGTEPAAWKLEKEPQEEEIKVVSTIQGFTWQPRRVHLVPANNGTCSYSNSDSLVLIREMVYDPAWKMKGEWTDPNVAYMFRGKKRDPLRPQKDRELWRDYGPLMLLRKDTYMSSKKVMYEKPAVVAQAEIIRKESPDAKKTPLVVEVYGLRTRQKKIFEWQHEILSLKPELVNNKLAAYEMQWAMDLASDGEYAIKKALRLLYPPSGRKSNKKAFDTVFNGAKQQYWDRLKVVYERDFIGQIIAMDQDDPNAAGKIRAWWVETIADIGGKELYKAIGPLNTNAAFLQRQVDARKNFYRFVGSKRKSLQPISSKSSGPAKKKGNSDSPKRVTKKAKRAGSVTTTAAPEPTVPVKRTAKRPPETGSLDDFIRRK